MKSSVDVISTLERKLNIQVPAAQVGEAFEKAYREVQKHVAIKGFRKGKAPMQTVRSLYSDRIKQDVVQDIVQHHYAAALDEHSLEPISYPTIEFDALEENKDFSFTAEFEIRPEVKVAQYEGLPVKKEKLEIKDSTVDETLEEIRKSRAELVDVLEDRPSQKGDVAVIDFEGMLLTGPLENGSAQDFNLELGANQFIPGFEDAVVGMKVGVTQDVKLNFPEAYHVADLAGKPVTFKVTLKGLKKKELPALNDEFVKALGPYESLEALRKIVREDFEQRESKRINDDLKNRLMKVLVERNPVDVPKALMAEQKKALIDDVEKRFKDQGLNHEAFEDYKKKWDADFESTARFMIQSGFLVDSIAQEHKLFATDADFNAKIQGFAAQSGIEPEKVASFYNEPNRRGRLNFQITEEKVMDFLLSKAMLVEVSREEIEKEEGPSTDA